MKYINSEGREIDFITQLENEALATTFIHFKGKLYKIFTLAIDSETREKIVVYQALYDDFKFYTRSAEMFFSKIDKNKYPLVKQNYRFEKK